MQSVCRATGAYQNKKLYSTMLLPVVLAACLAIVTGARGAQADDEPAAKREPRIVTINVLAVSSSNARPQGSCKPVRVTAGIEEDSRLRVGFFETEVGGSGPTAQWRSAGWMAADRVAPSGSASERFASFL